MAKNNEFDLTPVKIIRHSSLVYEYYDYLKAHCLGRENGISRDKLKNIFGISLDLQKQILREINSSLDLDKIVSTSHSIYICNTEQECKIAIHNEIYSGLARINKGKIMAQKLGRNNQGKIKLGKYYKDFIETFSEE